ncbi:hypothetical protein IMSHALPRED_000987 [Imshaugia aleurites]|uniref:Uncharacterized protein n=1 Tax=Imshaugia aleurites TaxID=172621 RepID=A0A8H3IEW7_9LECA|nr:hypothetical protein IMSHALPRED_000987 [Imshaugia aleurites]
MRIEHCRFWDSYETQGQNLTAGAALIESPAGLLPNKSELKTMAFSSLKKMSEVQEGKEGSYASLEKMPLARFANYDLGLTLLPGSQVQRKDEKSLGNAAESSPKHLASKDHGRSRTWEFSETLRQPKHAVQEAASPNKAKSRSSSSKPGPEAAKPPLVTAPISQERPAAPYAEQRMSTGEIRFANSCQHDDSSPRSMKRRKVVSNEMRDSKVSKGKEKSAIIEPEDMAVHGKPRASGVLASKPSPKQQHTKSEKLASDHQPPNISKSVSTRYLKHSRLSPDTFVEIGTQVLKARKEAKRSWTSHFPAKAQIVHRANLPAPSFQAALFTPSQDRQYPQWNNALLPSKNFHTHTHLSSKDPSPSLSQFLNLSKAFNIPLDVCALEKIFDTAKPGHQRQSNRRRSASMPNIPSTYTPTISMNISNIFGPSPMPTPPREQLSPPEHALSHADAFINTNNSFSQNSQFNSSYQTQHNSRGSDTRRMGLPSNLHHQDMTSPCVSNNGAMAADGPQYSRRRLEVKPYYSYEEVKSLMCNAIKQNKMLNADNASLSADNASLQSSNNAMRMGLESLQSEKADMTQKIQDYERTVAQNDKQIGLMQQKGSELQRQSTQLWDKYRGLLATIRREDGSGNPTAIANKIRDNHSPNAVGAASQGRHPCANASPLHANGAQLPDLRHGFEQAPTAFQGHVQPTSAPRSSEANVVNASSRALAQPEFAATNYNNADSLLDGPARLVPSNQPPEVIIGAVTKHVHQNGRPTEQAVECVTIDLTDDSLPPSSSALHNASVHPANQSPVQGGYLPTNLPPDQCFPAHHPSDHYVSSQHPSGLSPQNHMSQSQLRPDRDVQDKDLEVMQLQKEALTRKAQKPFGWLEGYNPRTDGSTNLQPRGLPDSRRSQNKPKKNLPAQYSRAGSVAPLPETATGRKTKSKAPKKPKIVLDAEAKRERAKVYRKTAAEKKKREKEMMENQLLEDEAMPNNAMRAHKHERRAAKGVLRQEQARKPSAEVRPREPQKTLDGRMYQEDTGVQQTKDGRSLEQVASEDQDSLFGDDEDMEDVQSSPDADGVTDDDPPAMEEDVDSEYVAYLEAQLEEDADAATVVEQDDAVVGDHGFHDFSSESEESEEE